MSGSEGGGGPNPRIPSGLSLEQARELRRGNAIHQLQQNYQALSQEVTNMSTELREVLAHLRGGPGGGLGRTPRGVSPSSHSSSSHEELRQEGKEG